MNKKPLLQNLPASLLIGFRDVLSSSLSISVTIVGADGQELEIEKSKIGRKYVQNVCQKFHFNEEESRTTWESCKKWDKEAAVAIANGKQIPSECWCKFACFATPIIVNQEIQGLILAGERRIKGRHSDDEYEEVRIKGKDMLINNDYFKELPPIEQNERIFEYDELFTKSKTESLITQEYFDSCTYILTKFANLLGKLIEKNIFTIDHNDNRISFSQVEDIINVELKDSPQMASKLLAIFLSGMQSALSNWLDLLDPAALSPEISGGQLLHGFVIFIDIRDFTKLCEKYAITTVQKSKLILFGKIIDTVHKYNGVVDSFVGDAMVIHLTERKGENICKQNAAKCAYEIAQLEIKVGSDVFKLGIGISHGEFLYTHNYFPSATKRLEVGIVGPVVNRSSRLCDLARKFGAIDQYMIPPLMVFDYEVKRHFEGVSGFQIIELESVRLKGYENHEKLFTLKKISDSILHGKQFSNFACGALGSPSNRVVDAMTDYYQKTRTDKQTQWKEVSRQVSNIMGCDERRVIFKSNATTAISSAFTITKELFARGFFESLNEEKHTHHPSVLMSSSEHPAVYEIAKLAFSLDGHSQDEKVKLFDISEMLKNRNNLDEWFLQWKDIEILFFPHVTWVRGTILPYRVIATAWKRTEKISGKKKFVVIDGAHALGHINLILEQDGNANVPFDFYATCGHKWLAGPQGTGILYASEQLWNIPFVKLRNTMLDSFSLTQPKEQAATGQRAIANGLFESCQQFCGIKPDGSGLDIWTSTVENRFNKIILLTQYLRKALRPLIKKQKIKLLLPEGDPKEIQTGITSFRVIQKCDYYQLKVKLANDGYRVTHININAPTRLECIRVCTSYNLENSDIDGLVKALTKNL